MYIYIYIYIYIIPYTLYTNNYASAQQKNKLKNQTKTKKQIDRHAHDISKRNSYTNCPCARYTYMRMYTYVRMYTHKNYRLQVLKSRNRGIQTSYSSWGTILRKIAQNHHKRYNRETEAHRQLQSLVSDTSKNCAKFQLNY
jgi:hypothetical protein